MKKIYNQLLASMLLMASSYIATAQTILYGGNFQICTTYIDPDVVGVANTIGPLLYNSGCPYQFFTVSGNGIAFYASSQLLPRYYYGSSGCSFTGPGVFDDKYIGFGKDVILYVTLTANLVPGNCYNLTFYGKNPRGFGNCLPPTATAAFQAGVVPNIFSNSFGTPIGTSALLDASDNQSIPNDLISINFMAPAGANGYITIRLADQNNSNNILFIASMSLSTINCSVLPIKLIDFSATINNNCATNLQWETASEINSSYFEIQRSSNGSQFTTIAKINSKNNNLGNQYKYVDNNTKAGIINYYRLNMVDIDRKNEYSKIINVSGCKTNAISIYPNPTQDFLNISGIEIGNTIEIKNALGQILITQVATSNYETLTVKNLPENIYIVTITNNKTGQKTTNKFLKQ